MSNGAEPDSHGENSEIAVFIMPRASTAWQGAEALWITVAGWASAAKKRFGNAIVVTTDGTADPDEVWDYPVRKSHGSGGTGLSKYLPGFIVTWLKDLRMYQAHRTFLNKKMPETEAKVTFVWEQHDLFNGYGRNLANKWNVPLITYVHAPAVWEAAKWGVRRPLTGRLLENQEAQSLKKSDLVACVSEKVKEKLIDMGVDGNKILVSPMSVATERFEVQPEQNFQLQKKWGLTGKFVFGWVGSFRSFHGVDDLIRAFAGMDNREGAVLLLVGDGKLRPDMENLARELGISNEVIFTGRKPFSEIPLYMSLFDVAIVSAARGHDFHYSPLKLREYLAAGIPSLAPGVGEIPTQFQDQEHLHMYDLKEDNSLKQALSILKTNESYRRKLGEQGLIHIRKNGTWEAELKKALDHLAGRGYQVPTIE